MDRLRENINVQEASTDKLIQADPLLNRNPKIKSLQKVFSKLFNNK